MQNIPPIEQLPKLKGNCKIVAFMISIAILTMPVVLAFVFWIENDEAFLAICIFLFLQIVSGVILSKMRSLSVPIDQREISFSTYEIAIWYVDRYIC